VPGEPWEEAPVRGWAGVAVPVLALLLAATVARRRDLPLRLRRVLLWLALSAAVLGRIRAAAGAPGRRRAIPRCEGPVRVELCCSGSLWHLAGLSCQG
jgi:hypothetical protein